MAHQCLGYFVNLVVDFVKYAHGKQWNSDVKFEFEFPLDWVQCRDQLRARVFLSRGTLRIY